MSIKNQKTWLELIGSLSESSKRWHIALKAISIGKGGVLKMHELTGLARNTIIRGIKELKTNMHLKMGGKIRIEGGGRKDITDNNVRLLKDLEKVMSENTAGDPMKHVKWTNKTTRAIAQKLCKMGHTITYKTVGNLLNKQGYSLQLNSKSKEGEDHPFRDRQFKMINKAVTKFISKKDPVISVDCKKKEQIGNFKNQGSNWRKKGDPEKVNAYDFSSLSKGKAIPYGTYDIVRNEGLVNVGVSYETSEFAIQSINQWWKLFGKKYYPNAKNLLICADGGGSNGFRNRLWKMNLQKMANQLNLIITVCHYPPATSKWNKIEHRMFSYISLNMKGKPLINYETIINLIGSTTTQKGLKIKAILDKKDYKRGIKISKKDINGLNIVESKHLPRWNYQILPQI
jgi:hypothetical protein